MLSHVSLFENWVIFNCTHQNDMKTRTRHSKRELEESGKSLENYFIIFYVVCFALTYLYGMRKISEVH